MDTRPLGYARGHLREVPPLPPVPAPAPPAAGVERARPPGLRRWRPAGPGARLWWVGCHGGSGESTLAALLPATAATDHRWPDPGEGSAPVVLVARTSLAGLQAAQRAVGQWAGGQAGNVTLLGLLLLADAPGKLPKELRPTRDLLRAGLLGRAELWEVDWVPGWRLGRPDVPRDLAAVLTAITRKTQSVA